MSGVTAYPSLLIPVCASLPENGKAKQVVVFTAVSVSPVMAAVVVAGRH